MKNILLLLLILGYIKLSFSQEKKEFVSPATQIITYDFLTGKFDDSLYRIKVHTPIVLKVTNVNPFAYSVQIETTDSIMSDASFKNYYLNAFKHEDLEKKEKEFKEQNSSLNKSPDNPFLKLLDEDAKGQNKTLTIKNYNTSTHKVNLELKMEDLEMKYNELVDSVIEIVPHDLTIEIINELHIDAKISEERISQLAKKLEITIVKSFIKDMKSLQKKQDEFKQIQEEVTKLSNESNREYQILLDDFYAKNAVFLNDVKTIIKLLRISKSVIIHAENPQITGITLVDQNVKIYKEQLTKEIDLVDNFHHTYSELSLAYNKLSTYLYLDENIKESGVLKLLSYPELIDKRADKYYDWLITYSLDQILKEALWVSSALLNKETFTHFSKPIQPENDLFVFDVKIKKRNSIYRDDLYNERSFVYKQPTYGGIRFDLSLGLAGAYYWNSYIFSLNDSSKIVKSKSGYQIAPSMVGMATLSGRKTGYYAWGGSVALGVDVQNGKIQLSNFFLGPTLLVGKRERVFVTLGASMRNVREMKPGFENIVIPPTDNLTSYLNDKYKLGMFVSISYSLTKESIDVIKTFK